VVLLCAGPQGEERTKGFRRREEQQGCQIMKRKEAGRRPVFDVTSRLADARACTLGFAYDMVVAAAGGRS
jgi:hypothetical protein